MSYLRLFYQIAGWRRPSEEQRRKPDGNTARTTRAWELSRQDGLGLSRGKAGDVKVVWIDRGKRKARVGNVSITGGDGRRDERVEEANAARVHQGRSSVAGHAVVENCMCTKCRRRAGGGGGGGGGAAGGGRANSGVTRRVRFDLSG